MRTDECNFVSGAHLSFLTQYFKKKTVSHMCYIVYWHSWQMIYEKETSACCFLVHVLKNTDLYSTCPDSFILHGLYGILKSF